MWSGDSSRVTQQVTLNAFDENVGVDRNPYSTAAGEVTALWGPGSLSRPPAGPQGEAWGPPQGAGLGGAWPGDVGLLLLPSPSSASTAPHPLPLSPLFPSPLLLPCPLHGLSSTPPPVPVFKLPPTSYSISSLFLPLPCPFCPRWEPRVPRQKAELQPAQKRAQEGLSSPFLGSPW